MKYRSGMSYKTILGARKAEPGGILRFASRYPDILAVLWILEEVEIFAYLFARILSLCLPFALSGLDKKAEPHLKFLVQADQQIPFRAAAARINLGYLMICGSIALFVFNAAPYLTKLFGSLNLSEGDLLLWFLVGQSAPILFGATGLFMNIVDRASFYELLRGMTAVFFLIGVVFLDVDDGVMLAQTFVAAQLTLASVCALLLTQCGIWPGLTAIFHKEIKLF